MLSLRRLVGEKLIILIMVTSLTNHRGQPSLVAFGGIRMPGLLGGRGLGCKHSEWVWCEVPAVHSGGGWNQTSTFKSPLAESDCAAVSEPPDALGLLQVQILV